MCVCFSPLHFALCYGVSRSPKKVQHNMSMDGLYHFFSNSIGSLHNQGAHCNSCFYRGLIYNYVSHYNVLCPCVCPPSPPVVAAFALSLRRQKRDVLSPTEEDEIHENIITYDDEGGGEADTAAFDIVALKSAPHSALKGHRLLDSRSM